jgi:hypothetical protein
LPTHVIWFLLICSLFRVLGFSSLLHLFHFNFTFL